MRKIRLFILIALLVIGLGYAVLDDAFGQRGNPPVPDQIQKTVDIHPIKITSVEDFNNNGVCSGNQPSNTYQVESYHSFDIFVGRQNNPTNVDCVRGMAFFSLSGSILSSQSTVDSLVLHGNFSNVIGSNNALLPVTYYRIGDSAYKTAFNAAGAATSTSFAVTSGAAEIPIAFNSDQFLRNQRLNLGMRFASETPETDHKQALMSTDGMSDIFLRMTYSSPYVTAQVTDLQVTDTRITSPTIQFTTIDTAALIQEYNNAGFTRTGNLDGGVAYQYFRDGSYLGQSDYIEDARTVTFVDTSLINNLQGQSYVYTVSIIIDGTHSGIDFLSSNAVTLIPTPGEVDPNMINPAAESITENTAVITWDVPDLNYNLLTSGAIRIDPTFGDTGLVDVPMQDPFSGRQLVTGLQSGRTNGLTVTLQFNNQGAADQISSTTAFQTPFVEHTRSDISLISVTDTQANISINGFDPGSYVFQNIRITVTELDDAQQPVSTRFSTVFSPVTSYVITDLKPATEYSILVSHRLIDPRSGSIASVSSEALGFNTRAPPPDPINELTIIPAAESITVSWQQPDLHEATLEGYSIYFDGALTSTNDVTHTFDRLARDSEHTVQVIAITNGLPQTDGIIETVRTLTGLADAVEFVAYPESEQIFMNWTIPAANGGMLRDAYTIHVDDQQHVTTEQEFTITRLRANTAYDIRVDVSTEYGITRGVEQSVSTTRDAYALISTREVAGIVGGIVTGSVDEQNMLFRFSNTDSAIAYGVRCNGIEGIFISNLAGFGQAISLDRSGDHYRPYDNHVNIDSIIGSHLLGSPNLGIDEFRVGNGFISFVYVFPDREVLIDNELFLRALTYRLSSSMVVYQPEGSTIPVLMNDVDISRVAVDRYGLTTSPSFIRISDLDHVEYVHIATSNQNAYFLYSHAYYFDFLPDEFQTIHLKKSSIISGIADSVLELNKGDYLQILTDDPDNIAAFDYKVILNQNLSNTDYNLGDSGLNLIILQSNSAQNVNVLNHNQGRDWTSFYHFSPVFNVGEDDMLEAGVIVVPEYYTSNERSVFCRGDYIYNDLLGTISVESAGVELSTEYECKIDDDFDLGNSDAARGLNFDDIKPADYCTDPVIRFDRPIPVDVPVVNPPANSDPVVIRRDLLSYQHVNVPYTVDGMERNGQQFRFVLADGFRFINAAPDPGSGKSAASGAELPCETLNRFSGDTGVMVRQSNTLAYNANPNSTGTPLTDSVNAPYYVKCTGLQIQNTATNQVQQLDIDISTFIDEPYFKDILADINSDIFGWGTGTNEIGSQQTIFGLPFIAVMALLSAMVGFNKQHLPAGIIIFITVIGAFAWLEIIDIPTAVISAAVMIGIVGLFSRGFK